MRSKARIADHPIHPMLILLPAGAFAIVLICDLVYLATGGALWWEATLPVLVIGVAGGLIAAIPGLIDFFALAEAHGAKRVGWWHAGLNVLAVVVFAYNAWWRWQAVAPPAEGAHLGFWLTLGGAALIAVSGWLGGTMVYRHGIGVEEGAPVDGIAARTAGAEQSGRRRSERPASRRPRRERERQPDRRPRL